LTSEKIVVLKQAKKKNETAKKEGKCTERHLPDPKRRPGRRNANASGASKGEGGSSSKKKKSESKELPQKAHFALLQGKRDDELPIKGFHGATHLTFRREVRGEMDGCHVCRGSISMLNQFDFSFPDS